MTSGSMSRPLGIGCAAITLRGQWDGTETSGVRGVSDTDRARVFVQRTTQIFMPISNVCGKRRKGKDHGPLGCRASASTAYNIQCERLEDGQPTNVLCVCLHRVLEHRSAPWMRVYE